MSKEAQFVSLSLSSQSSSPFLEVEICGREYLSKKAFAKKCWSLLSEGVAGLRLY
jgi:hypothetical protein